MATKWLDRRVAAPGPYLALVLSQAEFDAALKHLKVPLGARYLNSDHSNATAHTFEGKHGLACVVALGDVGVRSGVEIAGLLVHEAVHVWQWHCDYLGEHRPGTEQEAYAVQAIAQELMAEYSRRVSEGTVP